MITDRLSLGPPGQISTEALTKPPKEIPQGPDSFAETMRAASAQDSRQTDRKDRLEKVDNANQGSARSRTQNNDDDDTVKDVQRERGSETSKSSKKPSSRQKAMLEFMDSMESEFSIPPEKIVVAMANLGEQRILQTPEETAAQVIDKLGLSEEESQRAYGMYMGLLNQLSAMPNTAPPPPEMLASAPAWQVAQQASEKNALLNQLSMKDRRAYLNQSLDRMNQNFFMSRPDNVKLPTDMAMMQKPEVAPNDLRNWVESNQVQNQGMAWMDPKNPEVVVAPLPDLQQQNNAKNAAALGLNEQQYQDLAAQLATLGMTASDLETSIKTDPQNQAALKMEQVLKGKQGTDGSNANLNATGLPIAALANQGSSGEKSSDFFSSKNKKSDEISLESLGQGKASDYLAAQAQVGKSDVNLMATGAGGIGAADAMVSRSAPQDNSANVQQIMQQANYMIKKGGGEAIVKMNPEGLGTVEMKVVVNEGRVNVQLNAETHEAKKLLESSIHDLKHSLGAKNLALDTIKVDVGQSSSSSTDAQNGQQPQQQKMDMHQQGREQARQFFEQFRQDTFGGRNSFMDIPGAKSYAQQKPDPLKPGDDTKASSRRYQGTGKGSGLNLVA